jgi:electron transfer flavoprotein beta subunit
MKIVVCIKQVPDTTSVKLDAKTGTMKREGVSSIINPFDAYALEEAVRLKEAHGGEVIVLSMGPPQAEVALREAVSLGADSAILLSDRAFAGSDTLATSYTLGRAIDKIGDVDLVFTGKQATDGDTAQVGPGVAQQLGIPCVTWIRRVASIEDGRMRVERLMEDGHAVLELKLPALLTVVKEINIPRMPSIRGKRAAKKIEIIVWGAADLNVDEAKLGLSGSPTQVFRTFAPPKRAGGQVFEGEPGDLAKDLAGRLREIMSK